MLSHYRDDSCLNPAMGLVGSASHRQPIEPATEFLIIDQGLVVGLPAPLGGGTPPLPTSRLQQVIDEYLESCDVGQVPEPQEFG